MMSKKFGQNFLIDSHARGRLAALVGPKKEHKIWEIGPGIGALTYDLVQSGASVKVFEIDHGFCKVLRDQAFSDDANFRLIEGDFLKTWQEVFEKEGAPDILCSNLPYNVGSICIAEILENGCLPQKMVFTLQTEVAQRLCAKEGSKQWSSLSLLVQLDYQVQMAFSLSGSCFFPPPNVSSSVISLQKRPQSLMPDYLRQTYLKLSRVLFAQKRKTIKNNLNALGLNTDSVLLEASISPTERAENLSINQVVSLCKAVYESSR